MEKLINQEVRDTFTLVLLFETQRWSSKNPNFSKKFRVLSMEYLSLASRFEPNCFIYKYFRKSFLITDTVNKIQMRKFQTESWRKALETDPLNNLYLKSVLHFQLTLMYLDKIVYVNFSF